MGEKSLQHKKNIYISYQAGYSSSLGDPSQAIQGQRSTVSLLTCWNWSFQSGQPASTEDAELKLLGRIGRPHPQRALQHRKASRASSRQAWRIFNFSMPFGKASATRASLWAHKILRAGEAPSNIHFMPPPSIPSDAISRFVCFQHWPWTGAKRDYRVRQTCDRENKPSSEQPFVFPKFQGPPLAPASQGKNVLYFIFNILGKQ